MLINLSLHVVIDAIVALLLQFTDLLECNGRLANSLFVDLFVREEVQWNLIFQFWIAQEVIFCKRMMR